MSLKSHEANMRIRVKELELYPSMLTTVKLQHDSHASDTIGKYMSGLSQAESN